MSRGGKKAGTRDKKSRARLAAMLTFLSVHRRVSVRYCLYQLASRGLYPSTAHKHYRSCKELCLTARIAGELDDECFVDTKRQVIDTGQGWQNLADFQKPKSIELYHRSRWRDQRANRQANHRPTKTIQQRPPQRQQPRRKRSHEVGHVVQRSNRR